MLENTSIKEAFDQLAKNGYLGDPKGEIAYCYIRVSSAQQAEDGRSGLPRQLGHCHEVASTHHLKISWDMVFADDGFSGFEFESRPALSLLREEIKKEPRSHNVVIEHLDRLSRNARWHQGFLLDEFVKYHVTPVFWKAFSSEIERAVLGTISEEGMRSEISRMMDGMIMKAKSGRVTAKRPRFGYIFVDGDGKASEKARKDTHYAIDPKTAPIVRWIYSSIIREHKSLRDIAMEMNDKKIPTRFNGKIWCSATIWHLISDPVFKGEFYAHRFYAETTGKFDERGRPRKVMRQRPESEWIKIEVPHIISPAEWKLAQDILTANQKRSTRNMKKREWLLSTFIKCDICQYSYTSQRGGTQRLGYPIRYYHCNGRNSERARVSQSFCHSSYIRADKLEEFVWPKVKELITNPDLFFQMLEDTSGGEEDSQDQAQLDYIESQITEASKRFERWKKAYEDEVITLDEFKGYRQEFQRGTAELTEAKKEIEEKIGDRLTKEERKRLIQEGMAELRESVSQGDLGDPPFEIKRTLLKQLLNCIWINSEKKTIRFEGVLKGSYGLVDTKFVFSSTQRSPRYERCSYH